MIEFQIYTSPEQADQLSDQLTLHGADAVSTTPAEQMSAEQTLVTAYVEHDDAAAAVRDYLQMLQSQHVVNSFTEKYVEPQDWVRACLDQFAPQQISARLWICPAWHEPVDKTAVNVMLDPGLAFGTGTHATTRLCLQWLDAHLAAGETVIDFGCGSGILAIAALKLGASHVLAVDTDKHALDACLQNAAENQLTKEQLTLCFPDQLPDYQADVLTANILLQPLISLAPLFAKLVKTNGRIVLSGVLRNQINDVLHAYETFFTMHEPVVEDDWVRLDGIKK